MPGADIINTLFPHKEYEGIYFDLTLVALSVFLITTVAVTIDVKNKMLPVILLIISFYFFLIPILDYIYYYKEIGNHRLDMTFYGLLLLTGIIIYLIYDLLNQMDDEQK